MRNSVRSFRWIALYLTFLAVAYGVYVLARRIFGPYAHWTLWIRVPVAAFPIGLFLWVVAVGPIWRGLSGR